MPSLKSLFGLLALGALSATAAPAGQSDPVEAGTVMARQQVQVKACKDIRGKGECATFTMASGSCYTVPSAWNDNISSIVNPYSGKVHCVWWQHAGCKGLKYENQFDDNLADGNGQWNDRISSWRCTVK